MGKSRQDCLRQCVARIIGKPASTVPHFVKRYRGRWVWHLGQWLARRGYAMVYAHGSATRPVTMAGFRPERWIEIGPTNVGKHHHAVVYGPKGPVYNGGRPLKRSNRVLVIVRTRRPLRPSRRCG